VIVGDSRTQYPDQTPAVTKYQFPSWFVTGLSMLLGAVEVTASV
jgi:hypothetical protein